MAHHSIGDVGDGRLGSWGFPEGGMGAVAAAIASSARSHRRHDQDRRPGRQGHRRPRHRPRHRRRPGERRGDHAPRSIVTSLHPKTAFLDHVGRENLPATSRPTSSTGRPGPASSRSTWRSAELPDFTANPGTTCRSTTPARSRWRRRMEYIERAFIDAREGRPAARPFSDGVIPTTFDKTLAPEGHHIMSLFTQWVPSELERGAAPRGTGEVRRPGDRHLQRGRAQLQVARSCTATWSAPTRWSTTTA